MEVRMNKFFKVSMVCLVSIVISCVVIAAGCANSGCCKEMKDVNVTVANIENGVTLTFAAKTPEALKAIQSKLATCTDTKGCDICGMKGVKREVKNTENGAVMTLTAEKAKTVKKLQDAVAKENAEKAGCSKEKKAGCSAEQQKTCPHHQAETK
jgi:hypothetical protein